MKSLEHHLATTWYKNMPSLRTCEPDWPGWERERAQREPPKLLATGSFADRIWSTPGYVSSGLIVFGCYDNAIHAVREQDLTEMWRVQTGGPIYSSCGVLADGSFVIGCDDGLLRKITNSGALQWTFRGGAPFHGTPTICSSRAVVYAGCYDGNMYAVGLDDGELVWSHASHPEEEDDVYSSAALVDGDAIIYGTGREIIRLEGDGQKTFQIDTDGYVEASAAIDLSVNIGVCGSYDHCIYRFNSQTGQVLGKYETGAPIKCSAAISPNGVACMGSDDQFLYGLDLATGEMRWRHFLGCEVRWTAISTVPTGDFLLLGADGALRLVNANDGNLLWRVVPPKGGHSPPLITPSGRIVVGSHFGFLYLFGWD